MLLYSGSSTLFVEDATHNRVAEKLKVAYFNRYRREAGPSEVESWRNSLRAMAMVLINGEFDDHGVLLEYELPLSSLRLDCLVTGKDSLGKDNAVIVELKQWQQCSEGTGDKVVTFLAGDHREVLHPAVQVGQYCTFLRDGQTVFYEAPHPIRLSACCYLHNYALTPADALLAPKFQEIVQQNPVFDIDGVPALTGFMKERVGEGDGLGSLRRIGESKYRPSKKLLDHVGKIVDGKSEYVLLDQQLVAFNRVLAEAEAGYRDRRKSVVLVRGGPGTGKSVIALNLVAELSRRGLNAHYATGSKSFTETLRSIAGRRASQQFRYFNSYTQ